jgi:hypothetical protein
MRWCGLDNRIVKRFRALLENVRIRRRKKAHQTVRVTVVSTGRRFISYQVLYCI